MLLSSFGSLRPSFTSFAIPPKFDHSKVFQSCSGAAQRWFASLDPSRRRTWADLGQEFIRQYSFNTVVDVSRRELEALRQGPDEFFPFGLKGKKPDRDLCLDVGTIGMTGHRSAHRPPFQSQFLGTPYQMIQHDRYKPVAPIRPAGTTYLHPPPQYMLQAPQRPPMQFHHQYRAPPPPRSVRQFTQLGMPLSRAFQRLVEGGLIAPLPPRPPLQPTPPGFRTDLHSTDPLPTHDTRAVPPPPEGVHLIEFAKDEIFMMDNEIPRPFSLTPDKIYGPPPVSPVYLQHVPPMTPFILFPEEYRPPHRDVQIVTRSGREEVQREDDEILRQLRTTQARISIWSLLASSSTHRDALGLIHMLTADRATCIVFSDDDLPPEGPNHVRPLFIDVVCSGRRVSLLLDNGYI
ncbi:hypothetical protein AAG906_017552 [Vitis piasezkii]